LTGVERIAVARMILRVLASRKKVCSSSDWGGGSAAWEANSSAACSIRTVIEGGTAMGDGGGEETPGWKTQLMRGRWYTA